MRIRNIGLWAIVTLALAGVSCKPDEIRVATVAVQGVSLQPASATLQEGETFQLEATDSPADATEKGVEWSTNNDKAAVVDEKDSSRRWLPGL